MLTLVYIGIAEMYLRSKTTRNTCQRNPKAYFSKTNAKGDKKLIETIKDYLQQKTNQVVKKSKRLKQSLLISIWLHNSDYP